MDRKGANGGGFNWSFEKRSCKSSLWVWQSDDGGLMMEGEGGREIGGL